MGSYFLTLDPPAVPADDQRLPLVVDADELDTAVNDGAPKCTILSTLLIQIPKRRHRLR